MDAKGLREKFSEFALEASRFSREAFPAPPPPARASETVGRNVAIARAVFGKWSPEIMTALYTARRLGFEELRQDLRPVSRRVLSMKLKGLEGAGMVARKPVKGGGRRVEYSLTEDGLLVARLAEPFFLFLRLELSGGLGARGPPGAEG